MNIKNLKPFDLEAAIAGKQMVHVDGTKVEKFAYVEWADYPVIIQFAESQHTVSYTMKATNKLLRMLPEQKEYVVVVWKAQINSGNASMLELQEWESRKNTWVSLFGEPVHVSRFTLEI